MNLPLTSRDSGSGFFDTLLSPAQELRLFVMGLLTVVAVLVCTLLSCLRILPVNPSWLCAAPQAVVLIKSVVVFDSFFLSLNPSSTNLVSKARYTLAANIRAILAKDQLLCLDVAAPTALEVQSMANFQIDAWLQAIKPSPQAQVELDKRFVPSRQTLAIEQGIVATQKTALSSMAGLGELLNFCFALTLENERAMNGLT